MTEKVSKALRNSAISAGLLALLATGSVKIFEWQGAADICTPEPRCIHLSTSEYVALKKDVATWIASGRTLTYPEYNLVVALLNVEAQKKGGFKFDNVNEKEDVKTKIIHELNQ